MSPAQLELDSQYLEIAISHQSQPIAVPTEGFSHGGDEGHGSLEAVNAIVLCNFARGVLLAGCNILMYESNSNSTTCTKCMQAHFCCEEQACP